MQFTLQRFNLVSSIHHILMTDPWDANLIISFAHYRSTRIRDIPAREATKHQTFVHEAQTSALNLGENPDQVAHVKRQLQANHRGATATCRVCESRLCTEHTTSGLTTTRETRPRSPPVKSHVFHRTPTYFTRRSRWIRMTCAHTHIERISIPSSMSAISTVVHCSRRIRSQNSYLFRDERCIV